MEKISMEVSESFLMKIDEAAKLKNVSREKFIFDSLQKQILDLEKKKENGIEEEIEKLKDKFVEEIKPLRVYLFGSFAKGTNREDSDIDFYIVVNDSVPNIMDTTVQAYRVTHGIKKRSVDILIGRVSDYEKLKTQPTIEKEVDLDGVLLYESTSETVA